jgi:hypothetical protein
MTSLTPAIALLCVLNLGSPQYRVRYEASKALCNMPWAEPLLRSHMKDSLEVQKRSEAILKHWQETYGPKKDRKYIFYLKSPFNEGRVIVGHVWRVIDADRVHVVFYIMPNVSSLTVINWKEVSFKEIAE